MKGDKLKEMAYVIAAAAAALLLFFLQFCVQPSQMNWLDILLRVAMERTETKMILQWKSGTKMSSV